MTERDFLELEGAFNFRDLGGLPVRGGGSTRGGRLLRGDFPAELSPRDEAALLGGFGLRTVLDLRSPEEVELLPGPWPRGRIEVIQVPLPVESADLAAGRVGLSEFYLSFVKPPADALVVALNAVLELDRHPLLVHCAVGKDRTGVVTALALELLGVERQAIVDDYVLSQSRMPTILARLDRPEADLESIPAAVFEARAETMAGFLDSMDREYGGVAAWAAGRGIGEAEIDRFRRNLLA